MLKTTEVRQTKAQCISHTSWYSGIKYCVYNGESLDSVTVIIFIVFFTIGNMSNDCNGEKQNGKITCITIYIYTHI